MHGWESHQQFKVCGEREKEKKSGITTIFKGNKQQLVKYNVFIFLVAIFNDWQFAAKTDTDDTIHLFQELLIPEMIKYRSRCLTACLY